MSIIDDFMSEVIDFDEKEKEETILFLANATLCNPDSSFLKFISEKVTNVLTSFVVDALKERSKGGEENGT